MREQIQGLEWIPSCQRRLRLKWGYIKDLLSLLLLAVVVDVFT